jgi:hypothetical protein
MSESGQSDFSKTKNGHLLNHETTSFSFFFEAELMNSLNKQKINSSIHPENLLESKNENFQLETNSQNTNHRPDKTTRQFAPAIQEDDQAQHFQTLPQHFLRMPGKTRQILHDQT